MAGAGLAGVALVSLGALCLGSGCSDLGYYRQSVEGHFDMMRAARPLDDWLADGAATPALQQRLELARRMREFSVQVLKLPDNASYHRYADLHRAAAIWNVVAAPALSLQLKTWCYPVTGCVGYRGYFARADADALAAGLRGEGYDVSVYGVPAYSTLGWSNWLGGDPLLNTFVGGSESDLARLIFHELAHQQVYVSGDTTFNESFATAVERIGTAMWLQQHGSDAARAQYAQLEARRDDFRRLTQRYRQALQALYAEPLDDAVKLQRKAALLAQLRDQYARLKAQRWGGYSGYDAWFAKANNAALGVLAAYTARAGAFEALFHRQGDDFTRFYAAVRRLADEPKAKRDAALDALQ